MKMKTFTGNAIALIAPLLILVPIVFFVKGTRTHWEAAAFLASILYVFWFVYVVGLLECIGLTMLGFAVDGWIKGDYMQVAGAIFGPLIAVFIIFGMIGTHFSKTPGQRLDERIQADREASDEAHRMETERMDQDFFDSRH